MLGVDGSGYGELCRRLRDRLSLMLLAAAALLPVSIAAQMEMADTGVSGAVLYEENCEMCHDVGGVGVPGETPPLIGNPSIDDREYLERVIREGVSGPIEVAGEAYDDEMVGFPELSDGEVAALIDFIQGGFQTPAAALPPQPEVTGDIERGAALFSGRQRLAQGGPTCLACHAAGTYGHLGGSGLGPDLSGLGSRYAGERGLRSALHKPPSPVMRPVYVGRELTQQEVADLAAFFGSLDAESPPGGTDWLLVGGLIGAVALFAGVAMFASTAHRRSYSRTLRESK